MHARGVGLVIAALSVLTSCGMVARQHPCWDYVAEHLHGTVPSDLVSQMAWERGAEKKLRGKRAPVGYYWKRMGETLDLQHRRQYMAGHELTPCPAVQAPPVTRPE